MSLRLYTSKEDSENFSKSFSTKLYPKFERSTFLFVDFSINKSYKDVFKIQVFYSENGFFYTKFISKEIIRHAFGKWNQLNFMLARDKNKPLTPLFIFDFPLDNSKSPYGASFANINGDLHILSKIYDLSDEHFKLLKKSYKLYKVKGRDYVLFDFGNCFSFIDKFLKNLETILDDIDFKLNDSNELIVNPIPLDSIRKREDDYKYCMICGRKLESTINKNLLELSRKFPARCVKCLEKIYALELYYKLNEGSTNMLSLSELKYIWDEEGLFEYNFELLNEYRFLEPFSEDIYKLHLNNDINESFNSLLNPIEEKEEELESKSALDDYFGFNDQKEKIKCRICGEEIEEDDGTDICSNCFDKQMTIEKIHKLIEYVKPGTGFSKSSLIEKGFHHIDLDIIITDLEENDLLRYDSDDLLILANKTKLNEFIREYSDSDEYIIDDKEENLEPQLIIYKNDLKDESSLDKAINLIDYQEYVECSPNRREGWDITLKKDGKNFLHQLFSSPFQAKLTAVKYLNEIGIIKIVDHDKNLNLESKSKSKKKAKNKYKYEPPKEGRGQKFNIRCPICGREFISYKNQKEQFCSTCFRKYSFFEKKALEGIISGTFDKELLRNILLFREEGLSDIDIAKNLDIEHDFLIKPLINFLSDDDLLKNISENLSKNDSPKIKSEVSDKYKQSYTKICPVCQKEFHLKNKYTSSQKYCEDCKSKYNNFELNVLVGINQGIYTKQKAVRIKELIDQGYSKTKVANMFNIKNASLIKPILKFLLYEESEEKIPSFYENENNVKICVICGKTFVVEKDSGQKYCNSCKQKFSHLELSVLYDIEQGAYTKELAIRIAQLKQLGKTNKQIADDLNLSHPGVITPILNFLLKDADLSQIKKQESNQKLKVCPICEKEFIPKSSNGSDIYCSDCKKKYTPTEINLLVGVKEGKFTEELADKFIKLQNSGFSNKYISEKYDILPALVNPIINYFLLNTENDEGVSFNNNLSKWIVKVEENGKIINLGFYDNKEDAILARNKYVNYTNKTVEEEIAIQKTDEEPQVIIQTHEDPIEEELVKQMFYKDIGKNYSKIILKGIVSDKDRVSIFNFISFINCNLNKLICEKRENDNYNILLDMDLEKIRLNAALKDLKHLGWENAI